VEEKENMCFIHIHFSKHCAIYEIIATNVAEPENPKK
jgi:hypothetical protein